MESDPPNLENSDHVEIWATVEHEGPSHLRCYQCNFCKRGFSNAQALGGHMNIHRKDRAKLKSPFCDDSQLSLDIKKDDSSNFPPLFEESELESSKQVICTLEYPGAFPRGDDVVKEGESHAVELQKLPLFAETPSSSTQTVSNEGGRIEDGTKQPKHISKNDGSLDLELRL
ncbi:hypothetical protein IFM89_026510 [Coptis chinensis]|uniref:C2H2-type domain-containing protein n=1 Tax=Coptis chinensis TaxID=261450 RepID=A0A835H926_9MAGN|nr:hypothetical protein IFM89_026510 [Coptis chinensis]